MTIQEMQARFEACVGLMRVLDRIASNISSNPHAGTNRQICEDLDSWHSRGELIACYSCGSTAISWVNRRILGVQTMS